MSTAPEHKKLTADEYFKLTENWTERTELIEQLLYDKFTQEQAEYGASSVGY